MARYPESTTPHRLRPVVVLVVPLVAELLVTLGAQIEPFPFSVFTLHGAARSMLAAALGIVSCGTRQWAITT
jgi:hypothetical protein